jgi:LmbE family N-acetylglucosaminyl deacetylase
MFTRRGFLAACAAAAAARAQTRPWAGRALVIVTAHADDFTIFAGGTLAKLIDEGYTAHLIRVTNDEKDSWDLSPGETSHRNTLEMRAAADIIGVKEIHSLDFRNDELDPVAETEIRARLIFWFRKLKPWTIFTFDPSAKYEENPDHKKTARAAEDAAWNSGVPLMLPEHFSAGLEKWTVLDRYYWARQLDPGDANRAVDIAATLERKIRAIQAHKTMMRHAAHQLKAKLAQAGLRLPLLDTIDDASVNRLVEIQTRERAEAIGRRHGLRYAEEFHYVPLAGGWVERNAVPLR